MAGSQCDCGLSAAPGWHHSTSHSNQGSAPWSSHGKASSAICARKQISAFGSAPSLTVETMRWCRHSPRLDQAPPLDSRPSQPDLLLPAPGPRIHACYGFFLYFMQSCCYATRDLSLFRSLLSVSLTTFLPFVNPFRNCWLRYLFHNLCHRSGISVDFTFFQLILLVFSQHAPLKTYNIHAWTISTRQRSGSLPTIIERWRRR